MHVTGSPQAPSQLCNKKSLPIAHSTHQLPINICWKTNVYLYFFFIYLYLYIVYVFYMYIMYIKPICSRSPINLIMNPSVNQIHRRGSCSGSRPQETGPSRQTGRVLKATSGVVRPTAFECHEPAEVLAQMRGKPTPPAAALELDSWRSFQIISRCLKDSKAR